MTIKNMIGKKFGRLTVVGQFIKNQRTFFSVVCDCGIKKDIVAFNIIMGKSMSCGCLKKELLSKSLTTHGMSKSQEFASWKGMLARCYNKNTDSYKYYGGRGIKVSDDWINSFENFYKDMGKKPNKSFSIDRIDNNGNYCKENCRWASVSEQNRNTRANIKIMFNSESIILKDAAKLFDLPYSTMTGEIKNGVNPQESFDRRIFAIYLIASVINKKYKYFFYSEFSF